MYYSEDSNERLIKKLGDEILKFQETLNVEKKVSHQPQTKVHLIQY